MEPTLVANAREGVRRERRQRRGIVQIKMPANSCVPIPKQRTLSSVSAAVPVSGAPLHHDKQQLVPVRRLAALRAPRTVCRSLLLRRDHRQSDGEPVRHRLRRQRVQKCDAAESAEFLSALLVTGPLIPSSALLTSDSAVLAHFLSAHPRRPLCSCTPITTRITRQTTWRS